MARLAPQPAPAPAAAILAAGSALPAAPAGALPDWVQLLPAGDEVHTFDGRGPYRVADMAALARASMADPRGLFIDEGHATDLGQASAPAMGWIEALEVREGALWGRVAWTAQGEALVRGRAYRGLSPVLILDPADRRTVLRVARASLVNVPNLRGLAALNTEDPMEDLSDRLAAALGLAAGALPGALIEAAAAQRAALTEAAAALGVEGGGAAALVAAARAAGSGAVAALQAELADLRAGMAAAAARQARAAAEAWMAGLTRAIPAADREGLVALHAEDPARAERIVALYPDLGRSGADAGRPPAAAPGRPGEGLTAQQREVIRALGTDPARYREVLAAETAEREGR